MIALTRSAKQLIFLFILVFITVVTAYADPCKPSTESQTDPNFVPGYLLPGELPNSISLLPPPPSKDSIALALDEELSKENFKLRDTPRWELATKDADTGLYAAGAFSCALNAPITEQDMPRLLKLLRRIWFDAGNSTSRAKKCYSRPRPFMLNEQPICTSDEKNFLRENGSYPSGHAAIGWAWALVLSEIDPEHIDAILARGWEFGKSREVCNVHWHSDVIAGSFIGASTVARLHADVTFRADMEAAKAELTAVRAKGLKPKRDCAAEAAAMVQ